MSHSPLSQYLCFSFEIVLKSFPTSLLLFLKINNPYHLDTWLRLGKYTKILRRNKTAKYYKIFELLLMLLPRFSHEYMSPYLPVGYRVLQTVHHKAHSLLHAYTVHREL